MSEAILFLKFSGTIVDVGNIRDGRGLAMEVNGDTVSITGLTTEETQGAARYYGQTVNVEISTARPDTGGDTDKAARINRARDQGLESI